MEKHREVVGILKDFLPVMDNLELALRSIGDPSCTKEAFAEGVRGIHRQLTDLLYRYGCRGFTSLGSPFDPTRHEAIGRAPSDEVATNTVLDEYRRGYLLDDRLFRVAQVVVSVAGESIPLPLSAPARELKAQGSPRAERSAANRPAWLLNTPANTEDRIHLIGRASNVRNVDEGKALAAASVMPALLEAIADWLDHPITEGYRKLAPKLESRATPKMWENLKREVPNIDQWIDDLFWNRVHSEIHGNMYEVAVLISVERSQLLQLVELHGEEQRFGRLSFVNIGPFLSAALEGIGGSLVTNSPGSGGIGIEVGHIVIKVNAQSTPDAETMRRVMARVGKGRRTFNVEFIRDLELLGSVRMGGPTTTGFSR